MYKKILCLLIVFVSVMCVLSLSKEKVTPQAKVTAEIEQCYAIKECLNPMNITVSHAWYLQALQDQAYGVFTFQFTKMQVVEQPEEKKKKKEDAEKRPLTYNLYLRAYPKANQPKEGKPVFMGFKSAMPEQVTADDKFLFAFTAAGDSYLLVISIVASDYSQASTVLYEAEFPSLVVADKMSSSTPFFFQKIEKIEQVDTEFTVWRNSFHYGVGEIIPYFENKFKVEEQPNLFLQLFGIAPDAATSAYNLECAFVIKQADKMVVRFKPMSINSPGVIQPVVFIKEGKPLDKGDYTLHVLIEDNVSENSMEATVDFTIL